MIQAEKENGGQKIVMKIKVLVFILISVFAVSSLAAPKEKISISGMRLADREGFTRIVFDAEHSADYQIKKVSEPERLIISLKNVNFNVKTSEEKFPSKLVQNIRVSESGADVSVSISLKTKIKIVDSFIILPSESSEFYRLVIDIAPEDEGFYKKSVKEVVKISGANEKQEVVETIEKKIKPKSKLPLPQKKPETLQDIKIENIYDNPKTKDITKPEVKTKVSQNIKGLKKIPLPTPKPRKPVIIIDAGHGGTDPGAISRGGLKEKNITLKYALELRKYLEKSGHYEIIMTRSDDYFIPLKNRVEVARKNKADLFLSLHADSHPDSKVKGLSVYTVSEKASDREAERLAESENKSDALTKVDLTKERDEAADVLIELVKRETMNNSARFAEIAVKEMGEEAKLLKNSHRFAGFVVLTGIDVPSALVELGYLSNKIEEEKLQKKEYRAKLVKALAESVDKYFDKSYDYNKALKEEIMPEKKKVN